MSNRDKFLQRHAAEQRRYMNKYRHEVNARVQKSRQRYRISEWAEGMLLLVDEHKKKLSRVAIFLLMLSGGVANAQVILASPQVTPRSVTITWAQGAGSPTPTVAYNVHRSTVNGGPYAKIATSLTALTFTDMAVLSGDTYYYVVTAIGNNGIESALSNQATALIPGVVVPPPPPQGGLTITTTSLPAGTVGLAYPTIPLGITGGTPPYVCYGTGSVIPSDPAWTLFVNNNCSYSGMPSQAGLFTVRVEVTDAAGAVTANLFALTIAPVVVPPPPTPPPTPPPVIGLDEFTLGDTFRVVTSGGKLNVRSTPNGTVVRNIINNSVSQITDGPVPVSGFVWWKYSGGWFRGDFARQ